MILHRTHEHEHEHSVLFIHITFIIRCPDYNYSNVRKCKGKYSVSEQNWGTLRVIKIRKVFLQHVTFIDQRLQI